MNTLVTRGHLSWICNTILFLISIHENVCISRVSYAHTHTFELKVCFLLSFFHFLHPLLPLSSHGHKPNKASSSSFKYFKTRTAFKMSVLPWLLLLSGMGVILQTERSLVPFLVRAHAWVASQAPIWGCARINLSLLLSLTPALPPSLKINK